MRSFNLSRSLMSRAAFTKSEESIKKLMQGNRICKITPKTQPPSRHTPGYRVVGELRGRRRRLLFHSPPRVSPTHLLLIFLTVFTQMRHNAILLLTHTILAITLSLFLKCILSSTTSFFIPIAQIPVFSISYAPWRNSDHCEAFLMCIKSIHFP